MIWLMFLLIWGYSTINAWSFLYSQTSALHCSKARAEQVWLQETQSACMLTGSPVPPSHMMTSLPPELSWESFTLPFSIMTMWCAVCPCMKSSSSRANVRTDAHEAISTHSECVNPANRAEAHINTARSDTMDSVVWV